MCQLPLVDNLMALFTGLIDTLYFYCEVMDSTEIQIEGILSKYKNEAWNV